MKCDKCGVDLENNIRQVSSLKQENNSNFFIKNKKILIGCGIGIGVVGILIILYVILFGFEKLEWDDKYKSVSLDYVTQANMKIGFDISDRDKLDDVKINVSCGKYEVKKREITWDLKESKGKCSIELSYKFKKLKKEVTVIPVDIENEDELALEYNIDLDSDEDLDFDSLTNKQEKEYGTNPLLADTDMDGLDDYYEIFTSKTDPTKSDTDEDGLNDYDEIELQLDPLKSDSKGDGLKDGDRTLEYEYSTENVSLSVNGKGNIASSVVGVNENTKISGKSGMINKLYSVYSEGDVNDLTISISYTDEELINNEIIEDNLTIYAYKSDKAEYEKVKTELDKNQKKVKAKAKKGENYVVGDGSKIKQKSTSQILFVLDNSWSMYSNEQYKEITGSDYTGTLDGFDKEGLRFILTSDLIDKLISKGHSIGLSEFRSDYVNISKIGTSKKTLIKNLDNMYGNFATALAGTNIRTALENGMNEFDKDSENKYIIILTDGQDTGLKSSSEKIIDKANKENVKICSIGFGGGTLNVELSNISNATGCKFFSSSDSNGLVELFDNVEIELSDDLVDIDNDGESDAILIADSGFIVNRDGFSFGNYGSDLSSGGHCYGMATFAELYYLKKLPLSVSEITVGEDKSYAYDLRNTYFKKYDNLYSYSLKTNALKYKFGFELFGEDIPEDYRILDDDVLTFGKEYIKEIKDSEIFELKKTESGLSSEAQMEKYGFTYKYANNILLNETKMQDSKVIQNDDLQMFNAIYASFIKQRSYNDYYSSSMNFVLWLRDKFGTEQIDYAGDSGFINVLKTRLNSGDPVVIASDFCGLHAINAISLAQDKENPNYYYIGVYDNNYPGEKRYVDVECKNGKCVTKANEYYFKSNQPIRMTASLEYDLEYYKDYVK